MLILLGFIDGGASQSINATVQSCYSTPAHACEAYRTKSRVLDAVEHALAHNARAATRSSTQPWAAPAAATRRSWPRTPRRRKPRPPKTRSKAKEQEKKDAAAWAVGSNQRGASVNKRRPTSRPRRCVSDAEKKALEAEEDAAGVQGHEAQKKKKDKDDVSALLMAGLDGGKKKKKPVVVTKSAEKEKQTALRLAQEEAMRKKGVVLQGDDLLRANKNRQMEEEGSATGLDNALNMLGMEEKEKSKNLKVFFNEFSERETPKVRADNPGLKSQVKERVFRAWEESPDNPKNQACGCSIFIASRRRSR